MSKIKGKEFQSYCKEQKFSFPTASNSYGICRANFSSLIKRDTTKKFVKYKLKSDRSCHCLVKSTFSEFPIPYFLSSIRLSSHYRHVLQ